MDDVWELLLVRVHIVAPEQRPQGGSLVVPRIGSSGGSSQLESGALKV
jgi:hypothetical protein